MPKNDLNNPINRRTGKPFSGNVVDASRPSDDRASRKDADEEKKIEKEIQKEEKKIEKEIQKEEKKIEKEIKKDHNDDDDHGDDHPLNKRGTIEFTTGRHQVFIKTEKFQGQEVWIHIDESVEPSCSYLEADLFTVKEVDGGFILVAHIESNSRKVFWFVK